MAATFRSGYLKGVSEASIDDPAPELLAALSSTLCRLTVKGGSTWVPRLCETDACRERAVIVLEPADPSEPSVNAGFVDVSARSAFLRSHDALDRTLSQRFGAAAPEVERESYAAFLGAVERLLAEHAVRLRVSAETSSTLPPTRPRSPRRIVPLLALLALAALVAWCVK
jgi:hypothetical protein